jgi:hypothetical protein
VPRRVPGDPLTGSLPRTQLVIDAEALGPARRRRSQPPTWPLVPDPMAVTVAQMSTGKVAYVRTRWGIRRWQIRTLNRSNEIGRNRGRHYFTGMTRKGWCRSAWVDRVVSVQSVQLALAAGKQIKAIGAGK